MKVQTHWPTVSIGARDWRATTIGLGTVLGALVLILALQSGGLLANQLLDRMRASLTTGYHVHPEVTSTHRVSLNVHSPDQASGFSVAHTPPANVALSQRFSVGAQARIAFEEFGETALRRMLAKEKAEPQRRPSHDRLMLMLMLLRLHTDRRG